MRKRLFGVHALALAGALLFLAAGARAQTQTNVTATVTDPLGIPYANGTYSIQLIPSGNNPTVNGRAIAGAFNGSTDANGRFNVSLWPNSAISPAGTQWQVTVCVSPGVQPPLGTGGQCSTPPQAITISGASQDLSATLDAVAPRLTSITIGGIVSVAGSSPIVVTTVAGVATVSCPTCGTGTISGTISATHLTFASGANTAADVLGSAVTAGTGAIALTASGVAVNPLFITGTSAVQQNFLLNIGSFGNTSLEPTTVGELLVIHGNSGIFNGVPLVVIEGTNDNAPQLILKNQLNSVAGGDARFRFFNTTGFEIDTQASSAVNAGQFFLGDSSETFMSQIRESGGGPFLTLSNAGVGTWSANSGSVVLDSGTDNSISGVLRSANSAANAHTDWGSQATTSNEVDGPTTAIATGDLVSVTTVGVKQRLTDSGVSAAGVVTAVTASLPIVSSGGTTPNITCPTCSTGGNVVAVDKTAQSAAIGTTGILTCPASPATGTNYLFSWNAQTTTAASATSTLGPLQLTYTTPNGGTFTAVSAQYTVGPSGLAIVAIGSTANSSTAPEQGLPFLINCQAGSTFSYAFNYVSTGGTAMVYDLHIRALPQ